jgi:hypothetical protein
MNAGFFRRKEHLRGNGRQHFSAFGGMWAELTTCVEAEREVRWLMASQ